VPTRTERHMRQLRPVGKSSQAKMGAAAPDESDSLVMLALSLNRRCHSTIHLVSFSASRE
jgi:hypothetical protein